MRCVIVQLPSIGMGGEVLENYTKAAYEGGASLMLLGEYVLNPFFKELIKTPISMIGEQTHHQIEVLKMLAVKYTMVFIAPLVMVKKGECTKVIAKITPESVHYYPQQFLINYPHWNEEQFFANPIQKVKSPMIFSMNGLKFAVMAGFELHFDPLWEVITTKNVDVVLIPSASTFGSHNRWRELIKMRAFTHNCYLLRANRVGEYGDEDQHTWKFYGDSMMVTPFGEVETNLSSSEELLIVDLDPTVLYDAKKGWGFNEAIQKRSRGKKG